MTRLFVFIYCMLCFSLNKVTCIAQYNNVWIFGQAAGLNFNSGSAVPIYSAISTWNSCASVCNENGQLLFYTDGSNVWDRNNNLMPNGQDLTGFNTTSLGPVYPVPFTPTRNSADGTVIIPVPGNSDRYYIFSTAAFQCFLALWVPLYGKLFCSVVDMTLNAGKGDVLPGQKGVQIASNLETHLEAIPGDNCNFWLVGHDRGPNTTLFRSFEITEAGISATPVLSNAGNLSSPYSIKFLNGELVASPNRKKLALFLPDGWAGGPVGVCGLTGVIPMAEGDVEVFDFDPATGMVSNPVSLGIFSNGGEFSPDNTKLYLGGCPVNAPFNEWNMYQFDLTGVVPSSTIIMAGPAPEAGLAPGLDCRLGPDNKIYVAGDGFLSTVDDIGVIEHPDLPGIACHYTPHAIILPPGTGNDGNFFPNNVPVLIYKDTLISTKQQNLCFQQDSLLITAIDTSGLSYSWSDGVVGKSKRWVHNVGVYEVRYMTHNPCAFHEDKTTVTRADFFLDLGPDTVICDGQPVLLDPGIPDVSYSWQDGSTGSNYLADHSGTYWVDASSDGCATSDTVNIRFAVVTQDLGPDTRLCKGEPVQIVLQANLSGNAAALWSNGSHAASLPVSDTGIYWLLVTDASCFSSDTVNVSYEICECLVSMPTAFSPDNDGVNDIFRPVVEPGCPVRGYALSIYNRWGQRVFAGNTPLGGWDGTTHGVPAEAGTYMYVIELETGTRSKKVRSKGDFILVR